MITKNIEVTKERIFINTAESGCGNDCAYCYTKDSGEAQIPIGEDEFKSSLKLILENEEYESGKNGTIISLSPDTDPFKTKQSSERVIDTLRLFMPLGNRIQISTKESIPREILKLISTIEMYRGQVTVFISVITVRDANVLEPNAASVDTRLENIRKCNELDIHSCLYIKPVLECTLREIAIFKEIIQAYRPRAVCVGAEYKESSEEISIEKVYSHPANKKHLQSKGICTKLLEVFKEIQSLNISPVFLTSACVTAFFSSTKTLECIQSQFNHLCTKCGSCDFQEEYIDVSVG